MLFRSDKVTFFPGQIGIIIGIFDCIIPSEYESVNAIEVDDAGIESPERIAFDPDIAMVAALFPVMFGAVARCNDGVAPRSGSVEAIVENAMANFDIAHAGLLVPVVPVAFEKNGCTGRVEITILDNGFLT